MHEREKIEVLYATEYYVRFNPSLGITLQRKNKKFYLVTFSVFLNDSAFSRHMFLKFRKSETFSMFKMS